MVLAVIGTGLDRLTCCQPLAALVGESGRGQQRYPRRSTDFPRECRCYSGLCRTESR